MGLGISYVSGCTPLSVDLLIGRSDPELRGTLPLIEAVCSQRLKTLNWANQVLKVLYRDTYCRPYSSLLQHAFSRIFPCVSP